MCVALRSLVRARATAKVWRDAGCGGHPPCREGSTVGLNMSVVEEGFARAGRVQVAELQSGRLPGLPPHGPLLFSWQD
jgi:hypothetical protein